MPPARRVAAARGAAWVLEGIAAMRARPWPYLQLCLWLGLFAVMPVVSLLAAIGGVFLQAGLVQALHTQASGGVMRVSQIFDAFRVPGAFLRLLPLAALKLGFLMLAFSLLTAQLDPALLATIQAGGQPQVTPEQAQLMLPGLLRLVLLLVPMGIVLNWVTLLVVPQVMLDDVPGVTAIGRALLAIAGNIGAMVLQLLTMLGLSLGLGLLLAVPVALLTQIPLLGALVQALVFTTLAALVFGLDGVVMHGAWRDLFADDARIPAVVAAPQAQIEA